MLSIQELTITLKSSPNVIVVESFSLELEKGESVALVGESGAGKSSVLHSILGLSSKDFTLEGKVFFNGLELLKASEKHLNSIRGRQIGFVSQNCLQSFDPLFRIGTQMDELQKLYFPAMPKKFRKKSSLEILAGMELVPPEKIYEQFADELSGGMVQRLALAFALLAKPQLLLADELTSALDKYREEKIMDAILAIVRKDRLGFFWVTHDLSIAKKYSDKILVLKKGRVVEMGETEKVLSHPQSPYTRHLIENVPHGVRLA